MEEYSRINEYWSVYVINNEYVVLPSKEFYCPVCASTLYIHDFRAYANRPVRHYFCDVHLKCSNCGLYLTFGLPLNEELYNLLSRSKLHGKVLRLELRDVYELKREVRERLEKWGYW